jgi:hypothetical protein
MVLLLALAVSLWVDVSGETSVERVETVTGDPPEGTVYGVRLETGDQIEALLGYTGRIGHLPRVAIDHIGLARTAGSSRKV